MKPTHDSLLLGVTVNHVLVSLAIPFYDLALHLCVLSTTDLTVLVALRYCAIL